MVRVQSRLPLVRGIDADPEQAKENKIDNDYPLHKAIKEDHPSDIILLILDAYPEAAKVKDSDGWYPIHKAVETKRSVEVITKITEEYKEGLNKCFNGDLPIHVAINNHYDIATILFLVENYPQSMIAKNECGQYPIELLMVHDYPYDAIYDLINTHKDGMKQFPWSNVVFAHYYEDMRYRFVENCFVDHLDIASHVYDLLSSMVNESNNDEENGHTLISKRNRVQSTDGIDKQSDDSSSIERKIDEKNEKNDALSIALNTMIDQMSNIDKKMQELTERIITVEHNIDEIRNERDRFFACDDSIKNQLTQMTEFVNSLKSTVIHDHS